MKKEILAVAGAAMLIGGCGGSGGSSSNNNEKEQYTVIETQSIDGYLEGASVCADLDMDYVCDDGIAQSTSDSEGKASISISNQLLKDKTVFRIITDAPVGTKVHTEGQTTVTDKRILLAGNYYPLQQNSKYAVISPFTTLASSSVDYESYIQKLSAIGNKIGTTAEVLSGDYTKDSREALYLGEILRSENNLPSNNEELKRILKDLTSPEDVVSYIDSDAEAVKKVLSQDGASDKNATEILKEVHEILVEESEPKVVYSISLTDGSIISQKEDDSISSPYVYTHKVTPLITKTTYYSDGTKSSEELNDHDFTVDVISVTPIYPKVPDCGEACGAAAVSAYNDITTSNGERIGNSITVTTNANKGKTFNSYKLTLKVCTEGQCSSNKEIIQPVDRVYTYDIDDVRYSVIRKEASIPENDSSESTVAGNKYFWHFVPYIKTTLDGMLLTDTALPCTGGCASQIHVAISEGSSNGSITVRNTVESDEYNDGSYLVAEVKKSKVEGTEITTAVKAEFKAKVCISKTGSDVSSCVQSPVEVSTPFSSEVLFSSIDLGDYNTCALGYNGKAWCWGRNDFGQLGNGSNADENVPVSVNGDHNFISVSAGGEYTCGIDTKGNAWCWGRNDFGQLGNGNNTNSNIPTEVANYKYNEGHKFTSVSAGSYHTCGIDTKGKAWCWGRNRSGQLGNGNNTNSNIPTEVANDKYNESHKFTSVSAGGSHTCGIDTEGTKGKAWCWGLNYGGKLGNGNDDNKKVPDSVIDGHNFTSVSGGGDHTCGIDTKGKAWCWGYNRNGQLGNGKNGDDANKNVPDSVKDDHNFTSVSAGYYHTCGIDKDRKALCWGYNEYGQLGNGSNGGDGSNADKNVPVSVNGDRNFTSVSAGYYHTCGIDTEGQAWCWGYNEYGQLGDGSNGSDADKNVPASVKPVFTSLLYADKLTPELNSVSITDFDDCSIQSDNTFVCKGNKTVPETTNVTFMAGVGVESVSDKNADEGTVVQPLSSKNGTVENANVVKGKITLVLKGSNETEHQVAIYLLNTSKPSNP